MAKRIDATQIPAEMMDFFGKQAPYHCTARWRGISRTLENRQPDRLSLWDEAKDPILRAVLVASGRRLSS